VPEVSVVVPTRGVDVFREKEIGEVGAGMIVVPVRGDAMAFGPSMKKMEGESGVALTGVVDVQDSKRLGRDAGIDSDLSLIDDLFADLSLLP
jgi:hypothetical protein